MKGRIFVTGASGFVGGAVVAKLLARDYSVNALVRDGKLKATAERVNIIEGDLFDPKALEDAMRGCDAVIHLVGIIAERPGMGVTFEKVHVEGTRAVVESATRTGVSRYLHMSALGTRADAVSEYHLTKFRAEEIVRSSSLAWTIFRPSLIHGPSGEFTQMEAAWARGKSAPFLFMPYFGAGIFGRGGAGMLQPVYVKDVARAFVDAIEKPQTVHKTYDLAGAERVTWPPLHRAFAEAVIGRPRPVAAIPAWYARLLTRVIPRSLLPFNRDQVIMSQEDNTGQTRPFIHDFGWEPAGFSVALNEYAGQL